MKLITYLLPFLIISLFLFGCIQNNSISNSFYKDCGTNEDCFIDSIVNKQNVKVQSIYDGEWIEFFTAFKENSVIIELKIISSKDPKLIGLNSICTFNLPKNVSEDKIAPISTIVFLLPYDIEHCEGTLVEYMKEKYDR